MKQATLILFFALTALTTAYGQDKIKQADVNEMTTQALEKLGGFSNILNFIANSDNNDSSVRMLKAAVIRQAIEPLRINKTVTMKMISIRNLNWARREHRDTKVL